MYYACGLESLFRRRYCVLHHPVLSTLLIGWNGLKKIPLSRTNELYVVLVLLYALRKSLKHVNNNVVQVTQIGNRKRFYLHIKSHFCTLFRLAMNTNCVCTILNSIKMLKIRWNTFYFGKLSAISGDIYWKKSQFVEHALMIEKHKTNEM